jgi:hypothetical protein
MLPIGGALTAVFILKKWSVSTFLDEILVGVQNQKFDRGLLIFLLKVLLIFSSLIVGLIILNELFDFLFGSSLQKMVGF